MTGRDDTDPNVNAGYASMQLARALLTANGSDDSNTRDRAAARAQQWQQVFENIVSGSVNYGSRTPLPEVPVWATPEVVTGGFVTGKLLAGGPLQPHEEELVRTNRLGVTPESTRKALNLWYLTEHGIASLNQMLESGQYAVQVPEEAALLVVAFLLTNGKPDAARQLLEHIGGYFDTLRFYPAPTTSAAASGTDVFLWSVKAVTKSIEARKPNDQMDAQREAVEVWAPLLDELIELISQTVDNDVPFRRTGVDWDASARTLLHTISEAQATHQRCKKPHTTKANFSQLRALLAGHLDGGLPDAKIKRTRALLDRCIAKRGAPRSDLHAARRAAQRQQVAASTFFDLSRVVLERLRKLPPNDGVDDTRPIVARVTSKEASSAIPTKTEIPTVIAKKVRRCERNSVENLVASGVISSADTLAAVLPQITAGIRSTGIRSAQLRRVYAHTYRAFRRRRSLLLLNLEHQVELEELPWVAALEHFRGQNLGAKAASKQALTDIALLTLASFPQAIVPNKMLQELKALARGAELNLAIVDELAADIFMGTFTAKFLRSAKTAAKLLADSLYSTYYAIDYAHVLGLAEPSRKRGIFQRSSKDEFADLVSLRAGVQSGDWDIAVNGMQIEQQQILTTQNLAVLTVGLDLEPAIAARSEALSKTCFQWICKRLQANAESRHDHLIALKNSAYAWRQMVFFLSLLEHSEQRAFMSWAYGEFESEPYEFRARFSPALAGLRAAINEGVSPPRTPGDAGALFLGWTKTSHWLMPKPL